MSSNNVTFDLHLYAAVEHIRDAQDHLADALEAATPPGVDLIAKAMTEIERAGGMLERYYRTSSSLTQRSMRSVKPH